MKTIPLKRINLGLLIAFALSSWTIIALMPDGLGASNAPEWVFAIFLLTPLARLYFAIRSAVESGAEGWAKSVLRDLCEVPFWFLAPFAGFSMCVIFDYLRRRL